MRQTDWVGFLIRKRILIVVVHKWRHGFRGEGVSRILWQQHLSLITKKRGDGGAGVSKIIVMSFMGDPLGEVKYWQSGESSFFILDVNAVLIRLVGLI